MNCTSLNDNNMGRLEKHASELARSSFPPKLTDAEVITIEICGEFFKMHTILIFLLTSLPLPRLLPSLPNALSSFDSRQP